MTQEQLRMQMLAGIITEAEYKEQLNEGWKDWIAGGVITLAALLGNPAQAQFFNKNKPDKISLEKGKELLSQFKDDLKNGSDTVISDTIRKVEASDSAYFEYDIFGSTEDERITKPALLKTLYTIQNKYYTPDGKFKGKEIITKGELATGEDVEWYYGSRKDSEGNKKASSFYDERFKDNPNIKTSFANEKDGQLSKKKVTKNPAAIRGFRESGWENLTQSEKLDYLKDNLTNFSPGEALNREVSDENKEFFKSWKEEVDKYVQDYNQKYPDSNASQYKLTPELFSQAGLSDEITNYVFGNSGTTNESRLSKIVSEIVSKKKLK